MSKQIGDILYCSNEVGDKNDTRYKVLERTVEKFRY